MISYIEVKISKLSNEEIDKIYLSLLENKYSFVIMNYPNEKYILTKEKSFFKVENINKFLNDANNDVYYKTVINSEKIYLEEDLELFRKYIDKYKSRMQSKYGNKYLFGSVAVKTINNAFITTLRGKEDFDEFVTVNSVDDEVHIVNVSNKKATLNAPLLNQLFKNQKVKAIIHINHEYDNKLPYYEYAFPGTERDSKRNNITSFNIKHHGLFLLLDEEGNVL